MCIIELAQTYTHLYIKLAIHVCLTVCTATIINMYMYMYIIYVWLCVRMMLEQCVIRVNTTQRTLIWMCDDVRHMSISYDDVHFVSSYIVRGRNEYIICIKADEIWFMIYDTQICCQYYKFLQLKHLIKLCPVQVFVVNCLVIMRILQK